MLECARMGRMELRSKTGGEKANARPGNSVDDEQGPSRKRNFEGVHVELKHSRAALFSSQKALKNAHAELFSAHSAIAVFQLERKDAEAALFSAQSAITMLEVEKEDAEALRRDEKRSFDCQLLEERSLIEALQSRLDEQEKRRRSCETELDAQVNEMIYIGRKRDDALAAAEERTRELERVQKNAEDDREKNHRESLRRVNSLEAGLRTLAAERDEMKRKGKAELSSLTREKARLQTELDAARIEVQARHPDQERIVNSLKADLATLAAELQFKLDAARIEVHARQTNHERIVNSLEADPQTLAAERDEMKRKGKAELSSLTLEEARLQTELHAARIEIHARRIEHDDKVAIALNMKMKAESEKDAALLDLSHLQTQAITAHEDKLKAKKKITDLKSQKRLLTATVHHLRSDAIENEGKLDGAAAKMLDMNAKLMSMRSEKNLLARAVEEEREGKMCQICLTVPKDTITLPCLHLHYCFACLEIHKLRSKTCPTCRTPISGSLTSSIW